MRVVGAVISMLLIAAFAPGAARAGDPADYDQCQVGKYNPTTNRFYLDLNGNGVWDGTPTDANTAFTGAAADAVLANDWNDDGQDGIAKDVSGNYLVDLNENNAWDGTPTDLDSTFSPGSGTLISGRWTMGAATIGKYLSSDRFRLDVNGNGIYDGTPTDADFVIYTGLGVADAVLVGQWGGKPHDSVAKFYNSGNRFVIDKNQNRMWDGVNDVHPSGVSVNSAVGGSGDINYKFAVFAGQGMAIKGNWDGSDDDSEEIGIYVASTDTFYLDMNGNGVWEGAGVDQVGTVAKFAGAGIPVVCNWTGTAFDLIGKYNQGTGHFYLDGGNFTWDGNGNSGDQNLLFAPFDDDGSQVPVVGIWDVP